MSQPSRQQLKVVSLQDTNVSNEWRDHLRIVYRQSPQQLELAPGLWNHRLSVIRWRCRAFALIFPIDPHKHEMNFGMHNLQSDPLVYCLNRETSTLVRMGFEPHSRMPRWQ